MAILPAQMEIAGHADYSAHLDAWAVQVAARFPKKVVKQHLQAILARTVSASARAVINELVDNQTGSSASKSRAKLLRK